MFSEGSRSRRPPPRAGDASPPLPGSAHHHTPEFRWRDERAVGIVMHAKWLPVREPRGGAGRFSLSGHEQATTSTNVDGYQMGLGTPTVYARLIYAGGGEYEHHYVQALLSQTANIVDMVAVSGNGGSG